MSKHNNIASCVVTHVISKVSWGDGGIKTGYILPSCLHHLVVVVAGKMGVGVPPANLNRAPR